MSALKTSRRQFLGHAVAGVVAPTVITHAVWGDDAPSERIRVGMIGIGIMGRGHLDKLLGNDRVRVVGVCDVVQERLDDAMLRVERRAVERGESFGCRPHGDFRELLDRADVDAVLIATPDHWHAIPCVLAAQAGKDIYCEKPLTHNIAEGRKIVDAVQQNGVIFQTGSQQRSEFGGLFRKAVEYVRNGKIGDLMTVSVGVGGPPVPCDLPEEPIPEGTNWDMWLGPAPERPFNQILCPIGVHGHFPAWRSYSEYAGGAMADIGAHHFDIAQWALGMDETGPVAIDPPQEGSSGLKFTYANGVTMHHGGPSGCTFIGKSGMIYVDRGKLMSEPASILDEPLPEDGYRNIVSDDHHRNWLDCIVSREAPICNVEIGHRSASICHLANIGYKLRRSLKFDPVAEQFADDAEANALLSREPRAPWNVI
jgi:predicted dehydrogenase